VEICFGVLPSPVFVEHLGYAIQDTIRTGLIGETVVHGPGAPTHLPESPFQDIGVTHLHHNKPKGIVKKKFTRP
jgi:hypothetical protein